MFDRKLNERAHRTIWAGPPVKAFEGEGAKCKGCPFYGMLRSPLNLCDRQEPSVAPAVTLAQTVATEELDLPDGYVVNPVGYICKITVKVLKDHTEITEHTPLFLSRLRNFRPQAGVRKFIFETSLDLNNWGVVVLDDPIEWGHSASVGQNC
jgi:hypothetical protein